MTMMMTMMEKELPLSTPLVERKSSTIDFSFFQQIRDEEYHPPIPTSHDLLFEQFSTT